MRGPAFIRRARCTRTRTGRPEPRNQPSSVLIVSPHLHSGKPILRKCPLTRDMDAPASGLTIDRRRTGSGTSPLISSFPDPPMMKSSSTYPGWYRRPGASSGSTRAARDCRSPVTAEDSPVQTRQTAPARATARGSSNARLVFPDGFARDPPVRPDALTWSDRRIDARQRERQDRAAAGPAQMNGAQRHAPLHGRRQGSRARQWCQRPALRRHRRRTAAAKLPAPRAAAAGHRRHRRPPQPPDPGRAPHARRPRASPPARLLFVGAHGRGPARVPAPCSGRGARGCACSSAGPGSRGPRSPCLCGCRRSGSSRCRSPSGDAATGTGSSHGAQPRTWRPCDGSRTSSAPLRAKASADCAGRGARRSIPTTPRCPSTATGKCGGDEAVAAAGRARWTGAGWQILRSSSVMSAGYGATAIRQDTLGTVCSKSGRSAGGARLPSARTGSCYGAPYRQASRMARASLRMGAGAFSTNRALRLAQSTDLICSTMT